MPTIHAILNQYWGFQQFRPLQEEIIQAALLGKDTLALLPTGGGKSICFQVPILAQEGIGIVISPLIALMKDQVENLHKKGIKALSITSGMGKREIDIALDNAIYGDYKFLYLSPERLLSDLVQERIKQMNVNLIAVDEAHCISQWGYDFRPAYLQIAQLRELLPHVPILALTATATQRVQKDIQERLLFKQEHIFTKSFERKNLAYIVLHHENKLQKLLDIATKVKGTGIVYVRNRRQTQEVAKWLQQQHQSADFYHAGVPMQQRAKKQEDWIANKTRIVVATNAFGMGIDKPDVRFVVHLDLPESLEAYYQEAGRAGRDEQKAYAVLLYTPADKLIAEERLKMAFPSIDEIKQVYQALANYYQLAVGAAEGQSFDFDIVAFCAKSQLSAVVVLSVFKFLEHDGYVAVSDEVYLSARLQVTVSAQYLAQFQDKHPGFEPLLKLMLRSYTGVFDNYVKINENDLAKRNSVTVDIIKQQLEQLDVHGIVSYLPQKNTPQLTFLQARANSNTLKIDTNYLADRKQTHTEKMQAVVQYATSLNQCRSKVLLSYFNEKDLQQCGICDVCLALNTAEITSKELESLQQKLPTLLVQPKTMVVLLSEITWLPEKKKIKGIQLLLDEGVIVLRDELIRLP